MRPTFINVGERTNVTGSAKFRKLIADAVRDVAPRPVAAAADADALPAALAA